MEVRTDTMLSLSPNCDTRNIDEAFGTANLERVLVLTRSARR